MKLDLRLLSPLTGLALARSSGARERFDEKRAVADQRFVQRLGNLLVQVLVYALVGFVAAYLSFSSNTVAGWEGTAIKSAFAAIAFLFAPLYLLNHVVHKLDLLTVIGLQTRLAKLDRARR